MGKKKKNKKKPLQQQPGGYKRFLRNMEATLSLFKIPNNLSDMDSKLKRRMFENNIRVQNPTAGNDYISSKELKLFAEKTKSYYREKSYKYIDTKISTYQIQLVYCYLSARAIEIEKETGIKKCPESIIIEQKSDKLLDMFYERYLLNYFRMITQMSKPDQKYYGVYIRPAAVYKEKPRMELVTEIYGVPAQKCIMNINGIKRPAFRLGMADCDKPVVWISVDTKLLGDFYKGEKQVLKVFIQSHALKRIKERLDLLDREAINYAIWENTKNIEQFEVYKSYLLLPFKVFDVKIGYLAANIVEDKLLFRTYLFITHNSTPEGDKLKKLTGLGKHDISYWKIDRLSTFINLNENKHKDLIDIFCEAGLGSLMHLKDKEFDIDTLQTASLNGLSKYINKGRNASMVQANEWNTFLKEAELESEPI